MDDSQALYARALSPTLTAALKDTPVVCLLGPRQCGKTTLARTLAPHRTYISLDDETYHRTSRMDPAGFVASLPDQVTLDEVQRSPGLLPAIKRAVDQDRRPGRFLLTGSANLMLLPRITESLAGRMEIIQLHPLAEAEKERKPGGFLRALLKGSLKPVIHPSSRIPGLSLPARLLEGGYPEPLRRKGSRSRQWHRQYLKAVIERDVRDVARIHDASELARLLELLALRSSSLLNVSHLSQTLGLNRNTVSNYIAILERLYLLRCLPPWHRNPGKRLIKAPKVHLLDSGLAATLASLSEDDWLHKREDMGRLLESFVVQQLIAQSAWTDPDLRFWHYRDKDQVEVDLVITRGRQIWGVEVKAAMSLTSHDGSGLARLAHGCGKDFQGGVLLYDGKDCLPLGIDKTLAVPLNYLWQM